MILFEKTYELTPKDVAKDIEFYFDVPESSEKFMCTMNFSPPTEDDENLCKKLIEHALFKYRAGNVQVDKNEWRKFLPLKNRVMMSLDQNGKFLGSAHRWAPEQYHVFQKNISPKGFEIIENIAGNYRGMLHVHELISQNLTVYVKVEEE